MSTSTQPTPAPPSVPELENGDRLTRDEFERRYGAMAGVKKAELIEGVVSMPSPVRHQRHSRPTVQVSAWLYQYEMGTPGVEAGDNGTVRLDQRNEPQPDAYLLIAPERGGQTRRSPEDYVEGAPELVVEIASSSVSSDLGPKLDAYRRNGVREYMVWRVADRAIDWFVLIDDRYEPLAADPGGVIRSRVFPGLRLDVEAMLSGEGLRVAAAQSNGLASPEHAAFVRRLEASAP